MNMSNKSVIEKNILDIKLLKRQFICDSKRKQNTEGSSFDNPTESISVVKTRNLNIIFGNKTSLETFDISIRKILSAKH